MNALPVEVYPAIATKAVLDAYAAFLLARAEAVATGNEGVETVTRGSHTPTTVEEALAPLEILYGKTALSAIGIALHGAEPVVRYVEEAAESMTSTDAATTDDDDVELEGHSDEEADKRPVTPTFGEETKRSASPATRGQHEVASASTRMPPQSRARCLYHVGEHTLFSPFFCPCSAYAYQSIQRQEVWCCKHLLALQLALRVEATGLPQDAIRVRAVSQEEFAQLLQRAL